MALVIDVTERRNYTKKLEFTVEIRTEELQIALKKETELGELKSRFVSMASHEFRTPLSAILSSIDLIKKYSERGEPDKQQKHVERIKRSVRNLVTILDDFLSLEKMESGTVAINPVEIDLVEYISDVLTEVKPWTKSGQLVVHEHSGAEEVRIDSNLTRNVLLNLLSNALKYSPEGSTVKLITQNEGGKLAIQVIDRGMGIPEEEQQNMFTRFFRASNAMETSGTGLGLTIVKRYMDLMRGDIGFVSKEGKGTTFNIEIPIA